MRDSHPSTPAGRATGLATAAVLVTILAMAASVLFDTLAPTQTSFATMVAMRSCCARP